MSADAPAPAAGPPAPLDDETRTLLERAARLEKHPLARLVSLVERDDERSRARRAALFRHLRDHPERWPVRGRVVGITGTPGAGKSTLIGRLALACFARDPAARVAILAIDPTSAASGGALLGDRIRTRFPVGEPRLYFRSQATQGDLGGMGRRTFAVVRLLRHLFDLIFIETVGIGQSEIEVRELADLVVLVMQPLAGDHVQFLKAGIMEVPDVFVINKCDEEALARRSAHELRAALAYAKVGGPHGEAHQVFQTSAVTGRGVEQLAAALRGGAGDIPGPDVLQRHERHFLAKAVAERYGRFGVGELERVVGGLPPALRASATYEELESLALQGIAARIR